MSDQLDQLDYYTLLGVEPSADIPTIRRAFRAFAVKYHPDRFASDAPQNVERATAIYRRGSEALEVLTDPVARQAYDTVLARGQMRLLDDPETTMRRQAIAARTAAAAGAAPAHAAPAAQAHAGARTHASPSAHPHAVPHVHAHPAAHPHAAPRPHAAVAPTHAAPRAAPAGPASLRTPQARAFADRARTAESAGDLRAAWRALKAAVELEPGSAWLESELHRVGGRLR